MDKTVYYEALAPAPFSYVFLVMFLFRSLYYSKLKSISGYTMVYCRNSFLILLAPMLHCPLTTFTLIHKVLIVFTSSIQLSFSVFPKTYCVLFLYEVWFIHINNLSACSTDIGNVLHVYSQISYTHI